MAIPTDLVPQADNMNNVISTVEAISQDYRSYERIANHIGLVERQGRYYRKASEILGFTKRSGTNYSVLTKLGQEFLEASGPEKIMILQEVLLKSPVFLEIIDKLKAAGNNGLTDNDIKNIINDITKTTIGMAQRRRATIKSWLRYAKLGKQIGTRVYISTKLPGPAVLHQVDDPSAQILKPNRKLKIFRPGSINRDQIKKLLRSVEYTFDEAKREKAEKTHKRLIYMMAEKISEAGGIPVECRHSIDLATTINNEEFIFEMKSISGKSVHGQIRRGISQLYEYSYLHDMPNATLCLVMEKKPRGKKEWLIDYLINDRDIMVCWKADCDFNCPDNCKDVLSRFLS